MEKSNQKPCHCQRASCECADAVPERCACGDSCNCQRFCNCAGGCDCAGPK
jgi:hypothetical protein